MIRRVQVQMDLQFEVDPRVLIDPIGDLLPGTVQRHEARVQVAIMREVQSVVAEILAGGGDSSRIAGYVRIKGAIEHREMFSELLEDWLTRG